MVVTVNDGYCTHEAKFSSSESVNVDELSIQDFFDCIKNTLSLKIESQNLVYEHQVELPTADWAAKIVDNKKVKEEGPAWMYLTYAICNAIKVGARELNTFSAFIPANSGIDEKLKDMGYTVLRGKTTYRIYW